MAEAKHRIGTTTDAAAEWSVSPQTVRNWFAAGIIPGRMIGGRLFVDLDSALVTPTARKARRGYWARPNELGLITVEEFEEEAAKWRPGRVCPPVARRHAGHRRAAQAPAGHQPSKAPKRVSTVDSKGNRRNRTIPPKAQPGPYKRSKSTPGSIQVPRSTRKPQGRGANPAPVRKRRSK